MEKLSYKSLMVGDWVCNLKGDILQIQTVNESYVILNNDGYYYHEIQPIPLTSKILEKNGFTTLEEDSYIYKKLNKNGDDVDFRITIDMLVPYLSHIEKNSRPKASYSGKIEHVHKLQQILRLLGIEKDIIV